MSIQTQPLPRQGTLPFKRQSAGQTITVPEKTIEAHVDYHLRADGALVLSTVVRYKLQTCPRCTHKFRPKGGYGTTPGVPDRLARLPHWPKGLWLGLELKGSKTRLSPEQQLLLANGAIYVCRTGDAARDALDEADRALSIEWQLLRGIIEDCRVMIRSKQLKLALEALGQVEMWIDDAPR